MQQLFMIIERIIEFTKHLILVIVLQFIIAVFLPESLAAPCNTILIISFVAFLSFQEYKRL